MSIPCLQSRCVNVGVQVLGSWWKVATLLVGLSLVARQLNIESSEESRGVVWWWVLDWIAELVLQLDLEIAHALVLREVPLESLLLSVEAAEDIVGWLGVRMLLARWELGIRSRWIVPADGANGRSLVVGVREVDYCRC